MSSTLREIEERALNNWPSLTTMLYDGWLLRFANGYTKRANSIQPLYAPSSPSDECWEKKLDICETIYQAKQLPAIYKLTPFAQPANLDDRLAARGYNRVEPSEIQSRLLGCLPDCDTAATLTWESEPTARWIDAYVEIQPQTAPYRHTMEAMLQRIGADRTAFVTLHADAQPAACGIGVLDRDRLALYDIATANAYRRRGFGEQVVLHLLHWGRQHGASHADLAVVSSNTAALRLYTKLGFETQYAYWYRVQPT